MDKISLKLTSKDWMQLTAIVLKMCNQPDGDKYERAMIGGLTRQVYIKLHNKLHSLKPKNSLSLTVPEAAALGIGLVEMDTLNIVVVQALNLIDAKLT